MKPKVGDFLELAKFRLVLMAAMEAAIAFMLASAKPLNIRLFWLTFLGCFLLGGSASAFNQILERRLDALMVRTRNRPLPSGRLHLRPSVSFALILGLSGTVVLWVSVNPLSAMLGLLTLFIYLAVYTPLKRHSSWNTLVGAVPGALPCLIGWAAARNRLDWEAFAMFLIVFLWQMPHFFSIAWMYRDDYKAAGFKMLSTEDPNGKRTAAQILFFSVLLVLVSLGPVQAGLAGPLYLCAALAAGGALLFLAVVLARAQLRFARGFMLVSIYYLLIIMSGLAVDRL